MSGYLKHTELNKQKLKLKLDLYDIDYKSIRNIGNEICVEFNNEKTFNEFCHIFKCSGSGLIACNLKSLLN